MIFGAATLARLASLSAPSRRARGAAPATRARDAAEQLLADPAVAVAHPHDKQVGVQIGRQKQELVGDLRRRIALVHLRGNSVPVQPPVHIEPAERRDRGLPRPDGDMNLCGALEDSTKLGGGPPASSALPCWPRMSRSA